MAGVWISAGREGEGPAAVRLLEEGYDLIAYCSRFYSAINLFV